MQLQIEARLFVPKRSTNKLDSLAELEALAMPDLFQHFNWVALSPGLKTISEFLPFLVFGVLPVAFDTPSLGPFCMSFNRTTCILSPWRCCNSMSFGRTVGRSTWLRPISMIRGGSVDDEPPS